MNQENCILYYLCFFSLWGHKLFLGGLSPFLPPPSNPPMVKFDLTRNILRHLHMFFHMVVGMLRRDTVKSHARNHMSTITMVLFSYHCCDSNTDANDIATIGPTIWI